ncbi:Villin headpiece domain-containing protein [Prochlorococcus sp. AH-716-O13]|nr:Villin headpiece domain-containing protein [Prochlorococcus sp. AH-716-O13]
MFINLYLKKFFKILSLPLFLYLISFDTSIANREIKADKKLQAATDQDLFLYKGMGASYLCIASKAGIEFPKALGVASATFVQVVEGKHGGAVKALGDEKLERDKLFAGAEFQIVTTAIQYCPDSIPKEVTKKVDKIMKENKK